MSVPYVTTTPRSGTIVCRVVERTKNRLDGRCRTSAKGTARSAVSVRCVNGTLSATMGNENGRKLSAIAVASSLIEVSRMERTILIKPLELRKRLALKAANRERRSMSFANASNCCGVKLEQKKFCSKCHEKVNDRESTFKLAKVGKAFVKIPVEALKQKEEMLDAQEIVFDTILKSEPDGASEWYDTVLIGEPIEKAEKDYKVLAELGKKFVFVGTAVFNAREYQVIGKTVDGIFQIRKLVAPTQRNDIDRDEIVKAYEKEEVSKELLKVAEQVLAKNVQDEFNLNSFKPADEELEEKLVEAAMDGKTIAVPKASVAKETDEVERLKALLK